LGSRSETAIGALLDGFGVVGLGVGRGSSGRRRGIFLLDASQQRGEVVAVLKRSKLLVLDDVGGGNGGTEEKAGEAARFFASQVAAAPGEFELADGLQRERLNQGRLFLRS
jgi:hypothetical protein